MRIFLQAHPCICFILSLQNDYRMLVPNPTNAVGGLFILSQQKDRCMLVPKSHQRSWWIVHTLPTKELSHARPKSHQRSWWIVSYSAHKKTVDCSSQIKPNKLVDRSYSA